MEQKTKVEKTVEEIRADARQRKRNQRARDYAARDDLNPSWDEILEGVRQRYEARRALVPPPPQVGWWIGKSSEEIKGRLVRENPALATFFEKQKPKNIPELVDHETKNF